MYVSLVILTMVNSHNQNGVPSQIITQKTYSTRLSECWNCAATWFKNAITGLQLRKVYGFSRR